MNVVLKILLFLGILLVVNIGNTQSAIVQGDQQTETVSKDILAATSPLQKAKEKQLSIYQSIEAADDYNLFARTCIELGDIYQNPEIFNLDSALYYDEQAYQVIGNVSDGVRLKSLIRLVNVNYALYRFEQATSFCLECIDLAKTIGDNVHLGYCYGRMAAFSELYLNDPSKVKEYADLALAIALEENDPSLAAYYYGASASFYTKIGLFEQSLSYFDSTRKYIYISKDYKLLCDLYLDRGEANVGLKRFEAAEDDYLIAKYYADSLNLWNRKMHAPLNLSDLSLQQKKYQKAIDYATEVLTVVPDKLTLYELDNANRQLYFGYKGLREYDKALEYFETWNAVKDSMNQVNNHGVIAGLERKYKNEDQKKQLQLQKVQIKQRDNERKLFVAFSSLLALLSGVLIYLFLKMRGAKDLVQKQNDTIIAQAEELRKLDRVKSRFFANVSHELRTPLTLMLAPISSILKRGQIDYKDHTFLSTAKQNGQVLLKLIGSILDLSKMESGKMQLNEKPEVLFRLVRRIAATFESYAERQGIQFSFVYNAEKNLQIEIDKEKLEVILNNLLSNAMKFTSENERISVVVEDKTNQVEIRVIDTGRGIHPNDLPNIFNRFYQSSQEDAQVEGGTGIGLALSKEFATLMKGELSVQSELSQGSTFVLVLPRKEILGMAPEEEPEQELIALKPINKVALNDHFQTILIVEDNYSLRTYLETILSPFYNVYTAENGQKALDLISSSLNCQLILSDIMMPVMDGYQLLEKLKSDSRFSHLPVVMLTARADMRDKLKALRIGVDDYLLKPFEEDELLARIENLLSNSNNRSVFEEKDKIETQAAKHSEEDLLWLEKCENILVKNISDSSYLISQLANTLSVSESTLARQLKRIVGLTPAKYLQEMRLNKARHIIESDGEMNLKEIASSVGYSDSKAFSKLYKKRFGKLPLN